MKNSNFFSTIVAGENPAELMKPYDKSIEVEPYVVYKFADAEFLKAKHIEFYSSALKNKNLTKEECDELLKAMNSITNLSTEEFFDDLTWEYDIDEETNDAISTENPKGKYSTYTIGKLFSVPFITLDGRETFQARKKDINWNIVHLGNSEIYKSAWEVVVEKRKPENEQEEQILENMKLRESYFNNFDTKEQYITYSTAFWGYAFLDKSGWNDIDDGGNLFDWVAQFYDNFIKPLPDDTLLTIYECKK